jgi:hypothetical protein
LVSTLKSFPGSAWSLTLSEKCGRDVFWQRPEFRSQKLPEASGHRISRIELEYPSSSDLSADQHAGHLQLLKLFLDCVKRNAKRLGDSTCMP